MKIDPLDLAAQLSTTGRDQRGTLFYAPPGYPTDLAHRRQSRMQLNWQNRQQIQRQRTNLRQRLRRRRKHRPACCVRNPELCRKVPTSHSGPLINENQIYPVQSLDGEFTFELVVGISQRASTYACPIYRYSKGSCHKSRYCPKRNGAHVNVPRRANHFLRSRVKMSRVECCGRERRGSEYDMVAWS